MVRRDCQSQRSQSIRATPGAMTQDLFKHDRHLATVSYFILIIREIRNNKKRRGTLIVSNQSNSSLARVIMKLDHLERIGTYD